MKWGEKLSDNRWFIVPITSITSHWQCIVSLIFLSLLRKALKATAFLFPLLGMNQLIFCFNPRDEDQFEDAYMLINALLQSSQGIIVAILYCFTNTQVKTTIKAAYCRRIMLRDVNSLRINNQHTTNINLRNSPNNQHNNNNSSIPQCNTDNTNINCNSNVTMKDSDNDQLNNITVDTNDSTLINHSQFDCLKPHSQSRKHKSSPPLCKKLIETHKSPMSRDTIEEETTIDSNSSLTSSKSFDVITHHHSNHNHFDNHHHHQHHRHYQDQLGNSNRDPTSATSLVWWWKGYKHSVRLSRQSPSLSNSHVHMNAKFYLNQRKCTNYR